MVDKYIKKRSNYFGDGRPTIYPHFFVFDLTNYLQQQTRKGGGICLIEYS